MIRKNKGISISFIFLTLIISCSSININEGKPDKTKEMITARSILETLDHSIDGDYDEFIDLEHGYFELASSRITLFKDENEWAIVIEKTGYNYRSGDAMNIETSSFGNCLLNLDEFNGQRSNVKFLWPENTIFQYLKDNEPLTIRGVKVSAPKDTNYYLEHDIPLELGEVYPGCILRYLADTNPNVLRATREEVRYTVPSNLKKLMVIDQWHQDIYDKFRPENPPSESKTWQVIAEILVSGDTTIWQQAQDTLPAPNNGWRNWPESGKL